MRPVAIMLNYSITNIQNDAQQIMMMMMIIMVYEKSQFSSLTLAPIIYLTCARLWPTWWHHRFPPWLTFSQFLFSSQSAKIAPIENFPLYGNCPKHFIISLESCHFRYRFLLQFTLWSKSFCTVGELQGPASTHLIFTCLDTEGCCWNVERVVPSKIGQ